LLDGPPQGRAEFEKREVLNRGQKMKFLWGRSAVEGGRIRSWIPEKLTSLWSGIRACRSMKKRGTGMGCGQQGFEKGAVHAKGRYRGWSRPGGWDCARCTEAIVS